MNIKDSNNCGGYALFARICINLVCCEEQLTFEQEGFYKGDSIQAEFQDCSCMFCSFDEVQKNATVKNLNLCLLIIERGFTHLLY